MTGSSLVPGLLSLVIPENCARVVILYINCLEEFC